MNADDILKIIKSVPEYITFIYPGYLTIYVYYFLRGKTLRDNNAIILKSIAISYIYITAIEIFGMNSEIARNVLLILMALLFSFCAYKLIKSSAVNRAFKQLGIITTFYDNEIETLSDFDKGAWLCIYLNDDNVVYEGTLGYKELEAEQRQYISLDGYRKYFIGDDGTPKEPYIADYSGCLNETVVIFYSSIKRIERR
ncbi:MAG: hypothetical protein LIP16_10150 [Clostridium sp.]|nr:hypothetical protein [Clostridium sp.]DAJ03614.1 MAG TPA: hypothetical protein [Caudoviricetes sp.]